MTPVRAQVTLFVFALFVALNGCGKTGPKLDDFQCGGEAGYHCPRASICGGCRGPDCIAACYASVRCEPAAAHCPDGYACDPASKFCLPAKVCQSTPDCAPGEWCTRGATSKGVCTLSPCVDHSCQ